MGNNKHLSGVNLGGWLVLERWITPSLFAETDAPDEYSLVSRYPQLAKQRLERHWKTFITEEDFRWLFKHQIKVVRIPVGYWIFNEYPPFKGSISYLDYAVELAQKYKIQVLIDLHGAPGSQNGWDHSGKQGTIGWHKASQNIQLTLDILERLAKRYAHYPHLWGIELLNEPSREIPLDTLKDFYKRGYTSIRKYCDERVAVVIHDSFRPLSWFFFMKDKTYTNVVLDTHSYQCFTYRDKLLNIDGHIWKTNTLIKAQLAIMQKSFPVIIGEWSGALDTQSLKNIPINLAEKRFISVQQHIFASCVADIFWTYKTENMDGWSFRKCIEKGWIED